jgi:hypothetical protein
MATNTELIEQILQENTDQKAYISIYISSVNQNEIPDFVFNYAKQNFEKVYFDDSFLIDEAGTEGHPLYHTEVTIIDTDTILYEKINAFIDYLLFLQSQLTGKIYIKFNSKMYSTRLPS